MRERGERTAFNVKNPKKNCPRGDTVIINNSKKQKKSERQRLFLLSVIKNK